MCFHVIKLFLQFIFVDPIIIPLTECEIRTVCPLTQIDQIVLCSHIFLTNKRYNKIRISGSVFPYNICCPIRSTVLPYKNFEFEIGFLHNETVQSLRNKLFMSIGNTDHCNSRSVIILHFFRRKRSHTVTVHTTGITLFKHLFQHLALPYLIFNPISICPFWISRSTKAFGKYAIAIFLCVHKAQTSFTENGYPFSL